MKTFKELQDAKDELATIRGQDDICTYRVHNPNTYEVSMSVVFTIGRYNKQAGEWRVLCEDGSFDEPLPPDAIKTGRVETSSTRP